MITYISGKFYKEEELIKQSKAKGTHERSFDFSCGGPKKGKE